jgi:nitrite reductase/ring-hydroxylating ferredoxin subunit
MKGDYDISKKNLGKSLPPYPNGWYIACKSKDLTPGSTKQVDISGQNITLFRSPKGDVYALHSYCAHMGANLGIGGQVVNDTCIQCPFHGWLFDGETGQCVGKIFIYVDHDGKPVMNKTVEYNDNFGDNECKSVSWKEGK